MKYSWLSQLITAILLLLGSIAFGVLIYFAYFLYLLSI